MMNIAMIKEVIFYNKRKCHIEVQNFILAQPYVTRDLEL